jgi:signal transduction histidine kinase
MDAHIAETSAAGMSAVEAQMDDLQADFEVAAASYGPLATLPEENTAWQKLQNDVHSIREPIGRTLALSRRNQDVKARASLRMLDSRFEDIREDVNKLIEINREGASSQAREVARLQRSGTTWERVLTAIGLTSTLIVGWWAIWLVRRREVQLARYSLMLEDRNRDLDAFAGRVAHDLRAPLATINLAAWKLSNKVSTKDDTVTILQHGIRHMDGLIGDFLMLSRIGAEQIGECDPAVAAVRVHKELASHAEQIGGKVWVNVAPAKVRGTESLLFQALWNLADNAVKYRRQDVPIHVEITGHREREAYELRVSDNGMGMEPEDLNKAFDPFYRVRSSRELPGTGLGLSIVKRIVEVSGGTVSVDSHFGEGTTFIIDLPLAEAS